MSAFITRIAFSLFRDPILRLFWITTSKYKKENPKKTLKTFVIGFLGKINNFFSLELSS